MTIGQRIAQKRKELGLSQEALGSKLGVSRQSIYKWEADSALPEVDKLIALSRLFGVSVGWLLGVEEPPEADAAPAETGGGLTEAQLKMVEEIAGRYIAAQPSPRKRRRWPWVLAAAALCLVLFHLFDRLDRMNGQYVNLQNSLYRVESSVYGQIGSLSNRVEEILKAQNSSQPPEPPSSGIWIWQKSAHGKPCALCFFYPSSTPATRNARASSKNQSISFHTYFTQRS